MSERGDKGGQGQSGHASNEAKTIKLKKKQYLCLILE